ncbi:MAG: hypothetical protein RIF41_31165 [Polyangiaceae bacterium]
MSSSKKSLTKRSPPGNSNSTKKKRRPRRGSGASQAYRKDPMYPRIVRAVAVVMKRDGYVAPVEVLVEMGILQRKHLLDWRHGRVPYLERVIQGSLSRLSRQLRILRFHAHELSLEPSETAYRRHGKGPKQPLRFSKSGEPNLERAYATHFIRQRKRATKNERGETNEQVEDPN